MKGSETVTIVPVAKVDRLRGGNSASGEEFDLEGCHVLPRSSSETGKGVVGIRGFDVYYFGRLPAPEHHWQVRVRGELHEIDDVPRDFRTRGKRKALIFATKKVGSNA